MLDCLTHPITFPQYSSVKHLENTGNYAVGKYYRFPWRYFYRHKVRMIERALRGNHFNTALDFGSGPGLMYEELSKHANHVTLYDKHYPEPTGPFDLIVCASVLEFVDLKRTMKKLANLSDKHTQIVVASPMSTMRSKMYFSMIGDEHRRNSHDEIMRELCRYFSVNYFKSWMGLYFCAKGFRH